ncbi:hypothetical protein [Bacteroides heparinolyticus]|uniref:hypothetical protein n=1 Tax=Prevotella heparinolytica TaxID=28113 RepID=UPI003AEFD228
MEKKKTYVLTLSEFFPKTHSKAGMPTNFKEKFLKKEKLHTIRANYPLWEKRIKDIQNGNAVLSIRQWEGKPYRSKQVEIARLTAEDGVGIQKLSFYKDKDGVPSLKFFGIEGKYIDREVLANNDGLSKEDWQEWFSGYDLSKPLAIIHFTKFRY